METSEYVTLAKMRSPESPFYNYKIQIWIKEKTLAGGVPSWRSTMYVCFLWGEKKNPGFINKLGHNIIWIELFVSYKCDIYIYIEKSAYRSIDIDMYTDPDQVSIYIYVMLYYSAIKIIK